jgi:hypothetical protein
MYSQVCTAMKGGGQNADKFLCLSSNVGGDDRIEYFLLRWSALPPRHILSRPHNYIVVWLDYGALNNWERWTVADYVITSFRNKDMWPSLSWAISLFAVLTSTPELSSTWSVDDTMKYIGILHYLKLIIARPSYQHTSPLCWSLWLLEVVFGNERRNCLVQSAQVLLVGCRGEELVGCFWNTRHWSLNKYEYSPLFLFIKIWAINLYPPTRVHIDPNCADMPRSDPITRYNRELKEALEFGISLYA